METCSGDDPSVGFEIVEESHQIPTECFLGQTFPVLSIVYHMV